MEVSNIYSIITLISGGLMLIVLVIQLLTKGNIVALKIEFEEKINKVEKDVRADLASLSLTVERSKNEVIAQLADNRVLKVEIDNLKASIIEMKSVIKILQDQLVVSANRKL